MKINEILSSERLLDNNEIYFIDYTRNSNRLKYETHADALVQIENKLANKNTIIVKQLEQYNKDIWDFCRKSKKFCSCQLLISPKDCFSFFPHVDTLDVYISVLSGVKQYLVEGKKYVVREGSSIHIGKGEQHEASTLEDAVSLNFGIEPDFQIKNYHFEFSLPLSIMLELANDFRI